MTSRLEGRVALVTGYEASARPLQVAWRRGCHGRGRFAQGAKRRRAVARKQIAPDRIRQDDALGDVARIDAVVPRSRMSTAPSTSSSTTRPPTPTGPMVDCPPSAFAKTFDVNVGGTFELTRRVVSRLVALEKPVPFSDREHHGPQAAPLKGSTA